MDVQESSPFADRSSRASSVDAARGSLPGRHDDIHQDSDNMESGMFDTDHDVRKGKDKSKASTSAAAAAAAAAAANPIGKIRHLKKEDGEPLWRKDIQYDFLRSVFDDEQKVFTNSYDLDMAEKQSFADLYIDTMARSSKTSKVLRDKLLSDREAAKSMAMVCLLVNVGRMNTTLNFFPEMRAQLRTYHAIPSLQAYQDASAYKQLQDAPRLKSILKGAAEDRAEPHMLRDLKDVDAPRTNPVNLVFLLCQHAPQVAELHFPPGGEFHDLIMKTNYTSQSRARAFLWLMWFYLESDFTEEGCEENPFGAGVDYQMEVANQGVPELVEMSEEEEVQENKDRQEEIDFGREKQAFRAKIIAADQAYMADHQSKRGARGRVPAEEGGPTAAILPRIRPSKHESDMDSTRSTPPPRALGRLQPAGTGRRGAQGASLKYQIFEGSSPAGPSSHTVDGIVPRKPRPPTAHQLAVERNRNQRVEYILDRGLRRDHHRSRRVRRREGVVIRAKHRLEAMADPFLDSDEEEYRAFAMDKNASSPFRGRGFGGLCPLALEDDDFGEEFSSYAAALRRAGRRLARWEARGKEGSEMGVVAPVKRRSTQDSMEGSLEPDDVEPDDEAPGEKDNGTGKRGRTKNNPVNGEANGDVAMEDAEDLDDMDKVLLGIADEEGEAEGGNKDEDEELDDVDKALLGDDDSDASDA